MAGEMRFDIERMNALSADLSQLSRRVRNQSAGKLSLSSEGDVAASILSLDSQLSKVGEILSDLILKTSALVEAGGSLLGSTDASIGDKY